MKNMLTKIILKLPEGALKNYIKFFYFNNFRNNDFKIYYIKKKFKVKFNEHIVYFNENPYIELVLYNKGYFRKYKISEGDLVIDAGAYYGSFTLLVLGKNLWVIQNFINLDSPLNIHIFEALLV